MIARSRDIIVLILIVFIATSGCSSRNYILSGLSNNNPAVIDPVQDHTIYIETGNSSENQRVSLEGLPSRIGNKGYEVLNDPAAAYYWLQTRVVYCHEAKEGVTADKLARTGFGSGIGSGGTPMIDIRTLLDKTGRGESVTEADTQAIVDKIFGMAEKKIPGAAPPSPEGVLYLCVADVQITENNKKNSNTEKPGPSEHRMRTVAYVIQKKLNIEEATPIIQAKLNSGIAGMF